MATTGSHERQQKQTLPLSPPLSPQSSRRRHVKRQDSFAKFANTALPSPDLSPTRDSKAGEDQEPLLTRVIVTPVLFISFILSLSFVNLRDRAHRTYAHSSASFLTYLHPSTWLDLEPYQDPDDATWGRGASTAHVEPNDAIGPKPSVPPVEGGKKRKKSWHLNKKIRKMAKLEIGDALEMRGKFIVGMLVVMGLVSVGLWVGVKWVVKALLYPIFL